ncbi:synapse differentiation-inducing gene protein 1-like [Astyanax mexicanus]|uniref:Synapse differentiation-inducing gene protein 1-like n=1 Tax=Astyanax mexicanus TaxID=7994 RepID=A0A8T2MJI6_ASTMX|nr:synapse differentiation-inducing gene protein 1-like [Astyanax mexicanus]
MEPAQPRIPTVPPADTDQQPPPYRDYNAGYGPPPQPQLQPLVDAQQNVTVQPTVCVTPGRRKRDYLCCSIFTMLCCCCPLGFIALILSIVTREANSNGDF